MKYVIRIEYDSDVESPSSDDYGNWKVHSFNRRHNSFTDPDEFFENGKPKLSIRNKLRVGTAFILAYAEHGLCRWSIGSMTGLDDWDSRSCAGIAIFPDIKNLGAKSYADREKDCEIFLEEYTDWCNGYCFYWCIETEDGEHLAGCGGYIGSHQYMLDAIADELPADATLEECELTGDGADSFKLEDVFKNFKPDLTKLDYSI